jgi:sugar phosphate isomerase/epimerase
VHSRVTVSGLSFPSDSALADDVAAWKEAGVGQVGVHRNKLAAAGWEEGEALLGEMPRIEYLVHRRMFELADENCWPGEREQLRMTVNVAARLGARVVYGTTGPAVGDRSIEQLARAIEPVVIEARAVGVTLAFEVAPARHAPIHFLHTLHDTLAAARLLGVGVSLDIRSCAGEPGLAASIDEGADALALVQVNDLLPGRDEYIVPGRGVAPIETILARVIEGGYSGAFDVKLIGRPLDEVLAGTAYVSELLYRWGVPDRAAPEGGRLAST